jgi:hypothetical protein
LIDMLSLHQGLQKLSMHDQQLLEKWWVSGVVVAMIISIADFTFFHQKSRVDDIEKGKLGEVKR